MIKEFEEIYKLYQLGKDIHEISQPLKEAGQEIKVFVSTVKTEFSSLQGMFKQFAEAPQKTYGCLIKDFTSWGMEVKKTAKMVNMGTSEISSLFQIAAKNSISAETLVNGLKNLNNSLIDVRSKTGDAFTAFELLGISVKKVDPKTGIESYKSVIGVLIELDEKLRNVQDSMKKTALSEKIFGKEGFEIKTLFDPAEDSLDELLKKSQALNIELDDREVNILDNFNEKLSKTDAIFSSLGKNTLLDFISKFDKKLNFNLLIDPKDISAGINVINQIDAVFAQFTDDIVKQQDLFGLKETFKLIDEFREKLETLKKYVDIPFAPLKAIPKETGENLKNAAEGVGLLAYASSDIAELGPGLVVAGDAVKQVRPALGQNDDIKDVNESLSDMTKYGKELPTSLNISKTNTTGTSKPPSNTSFRGYESYSEWRGQTLQDAKSFDSIWKKVQTGFSVGWQDAVQCVKGAFQSFGGVSGAVASMVMESVKAIAKAIVDVIDTFQSELSDAFYRMFEEGQSFTESMSQMWENMKKAFKRAIADMLSAFVVNFSGLGILRAGASMMSKFKEGGFAWKGAGSLPKIPHAAKGLMTTGHDPIPAILHPNEVVIPQGYIHEFFGSMAERLFKYMSLPSMPMVCLPAIAGAGASKVVNINLNVGAGNFDDPSYWRNLFRTKIKPAMEDVNYGRI
jgi:hypothetical protein